MREVFGWPFDLARLIWEAVKVLTTGFVAGLWWLIKLIGIGLYSAVKSLPEFVRESFQNEDIHFVVYVFVLGLFAFSAILTEPGSLLQGLCLIEIAISFILLSLATMRVMNKKR